MHETFAVIPDDALVPAAYFADLEIAIEWAIRHFGSGAFRIRSSQIAEPERTRPPVGDTRV